MEHIRMCNQEGVQFLSDELSEVSDNLKLTVQLLSDDFAAVSEVSEKKSPLSSNKRLCYCRGTARRATSVEILWPFFD